MKTKKVIVLPYDPQWAADFEAIRRELAEALGDLAVSIEHVGSTAVPGLSAKPIIDLDVVIEDYAAFPGVVERLAGIGYIHEGDLGIPEREAFKYEYKPHLRKHHLYVCPRDSRELKRHLTFRDYLRSHPEAVKRYGQIKEQCAKLYPEDIDGYIAWKTPCIEELYARCGLIQK